LENSLRDKKDGFTYFGCSDAQGEVDFVIQKNYQDQDLDYNKNKGKFFTIFFDVKDSRYYIKDLRSGFGTFMKISENFVLSNNSLINIGDSYIVITIGDEQNIATQNELVNVNLTKMNTLENNQLISLKIFSGQNAYEPLIFDPNKKIIITGRSSDCDVCVNDTMLSRFHCSIIYNPDLGWVTKDGYPMHIDNLNDDFKKSTNGSWVYLSNNCPISEGMIFKTNHTLFECHLVES